MKYSGLCWKVWRSPVDFAGFHRQSILLVSLQLQSMSCHTQPFALMCRKWGARNHCCVLTNYSVFCSSVVCLTDKLSLVNMWQLQQRCVWMQLAKGWANVTSKGCMWSWQTSVTVLGPSLDPATTSIYSTLLMHPMHSIPTQPSPFRFDAWTMQVNLPFQPIHQVTVSVVSQLPCMIVTTIHYWKH